MTNIAPRRWPAPRVLILAAALFAAAAAGTTFALLHGHLSFSPRYSGPRVAVTVKPIHSLAAAIMAGVEKPELLITGADSPHTHVLRPSEVRIIDGADLIFWVGPDLESSFTEPLATLARGKVVSLLREPGITVYPVRPAGVMPHDFAAPADDREQEHPAPNDADPHIWLDPINARAIARVIAAALEAADPAHASAYARNAAALDGKLAALDAELKGELAGLQGIPFVVYHDAYHYLERRYGLNVAATVTISPARTPGAWRVAALRALIAARGIRCIFTEPEFEPAIVRTIAEGTGAKVATLDPEGASLPPGPDFYFTLMRRLARDLRGCLTAPNG